MRRTRWASTRPCMLRRRGNTANALRRPIFDQKCICARGRTGDCLMQVLPEIRENLLNGTFLHWVLLIRPYDFLSSRAGACPLVPISRP